MSFWDDVLVAIDKVEWSFESHDPVWAWVVVGMYSVAALLVFIAYRRSQKSTFPKEIKKKCRVFWLFLFSLMLFLAFNKQLDIQTYFTAVMREVSRSEGWYDQRRKIQYEAIIVLGLLAALVLSYLVYIIYRLPTAYKLTLSGAVCTFAFIGMRASSFHHFDHYVAQEVFGVKLHILIEIIGGVIVSIGSIFCIRGVKLWELYYQKSFAKSKIVTQRDEGNSESYAEVDAIITSDNIDDVICEVVESSGITHEEVSQSYQQLQEPEEVEASIVCENAVNEVNNCKLEGDKVAALSDNYDSLYDLVSNPKFKEYNSAKGNFISDNEKPRVQMKRKVISDAEMEKNKLEVDFKKAAKGGATKAKTRENYWIKMDHNSSGWM